jgi:hypothetical protein
MIKISRSILAIVILLSVLVQGQVIYNCHSENSIHLLSSCCDKVEEVKSCCSVKNELFDKQLKKSCCSEIQIAFLHNIKEIDTSIEQAHDSIPQAFYLDWEKSNQILNQYSAFDKFIKSNAPPLNHRPLYSLNCSFLC